ncbi:MAG: DUF3383 family protein [Rhodospirillaceae bacterium]|nr:DUF3383 family protein [Rhodospirillaceae bacterium]
MADFGQGLSVTITVRGSDPVDAEFGRTLLVEQVSVGLTARADTDLRRAVRVYGSASEVAAAGESADVQRAAAVYFAAATPPKPLMVGTQLAVTQSTVIYGAHTTVAAVEALGDGAAWSLGDAHSGTADFDGLSDLDDMASALQTGLNAVAGITGASVSVVDDGFQVQLPAGLSIGSGFVASDVTRALGLSGAHIVPGIETGEDGPDALDRIQGLDESFYFICLPMGGYGVAGGRETGISRVEEMARWAESRGKMFSYEEAGPELLIANEESTATGDFYDSKLSRVSAWYGGAERDGKNIAACAYQSGIDFEAADANRNVANTDLPGTSPTVIESLSHLRELNRKRVNYYRRIGGLTHTVNGMTQSTWLDVQFFLDHLRNAVGLAVYRLKKSSAFLGHDAESYGDVKSAIEDVLASAVRGGFLRPGVVSDATRRSIIRSTGVADFDGELTKGYLVYIPSAATRSESQRASRSMARPQFWARGADAINDIDILGTYDE